MRIKQKFDDYLTNERNEYGYRKISKNAPDEVKKEYDIYIGKIMASINKVEPILK